MRKIKTEKSQISETEQQIDHRESHFYVIRDTSPCQKTFLKCSSMIMNNLKL